MDNVKIIIAGSENIDDIMVIENLSFKVPWSRQSITEEIIENDMAIYVCAVIEGKAIGYAGMWQVCDEGHITNIAVHPEFRCSGIGSVLVEALLSIAEENSINALTLEVRRSNIIAQSLYRKYGFEECGSRKGYYADNKEDALIMWKHMHKCSDSNG